MVKFIIGGEEVELTAGNNFLIHINSIFKAAGMIYNFPQRCSGIGINQSIVETAKAENKHIIITVADNPRRYIISPDEIIKIANTYGSVYKAKGVNLFVVPLKTLKPLGEPEENKIHEPINKEKAFKEKICPNCGSEDLDFQSSKFYVTCGQCGRLYSRKNFVKR